MRYEIHVYVFCGRKLGPILCVGVFPFLALQMFPLIVTSVIRVVHYSMLSRLRLLQQVFFFSPSFHLILKHQRDGNCVS